MKKLLCILLIVCSLLALFCSCGKKDTAESTDVPSLETVRITFPEGYSCVQIAEKLEENNVCSAKDFLSVLNSSSFIFSKGYKFIPYIDNISQRAFKLEGYIFPDTYEFYTNENAKTTVSRFLQNTDTKLTDEYYERAKQLGYTIDEIIALASVIQKEAGEKDEMKKVSSVLHNRLNSTKYKSLQCDVTVNYINNYVTDSPYILDSGIDYAENYNTYKCVGLPLGAICNVGVDAIEAALYPADTDYFFFVTDSEMNYYYAKTYEEHQKNCSFALNS